MNRKEFDSAFFPMTKCLNVKVPKIQADLYYSDLVNKDPRDLDSACHELSFGKSGWMPDMPKFRIYIAAAFEMRHEKEKLDREKSMGQVHRVDFTPQERLEANRGAYEALRQVRECRSTGRNCWSPIKVREACLDSSKDEEIRAKYGDEGPSPALVFGGSFLKD